MELNSWSLSAIDQIFSTKRTGGGEPACPSGTFAAGYTLDPWNKWRVVCLSILSVEDVEDIYMIGIMIVGMLLIGAGGFLIYRKVRTTLATVLEKLPVISEGCSRALNTQTHVLIDIKSKQELLLDRLRVMDNNWEKLETRLGSSS